MIYGVVSIRVKPGKLQGFLKLFNSNAATVRKEKGCLQYVPALDIETGSPMQSLDASVVTVLETWEDLEALSDHLATPHMAIYFEKEKEFVESVSLKTLTDAPEQDKPNPPVSPAHQLQP